MKPNIIDKYEIIVDTEDDIKQTPLFWNLMMAEMTIERGAKRISGDITQDRFDAWQDNTLEPMQDLLEGKTELSVIDVSYLDGYYHTYLSDLAWEETIQSPTNFIVFIVILFIALVAMSTFRSPAVSLMPDVTPKPLRSKANAIINLMGSAAGVTALIMMTLYGIRW